MPPPSSHTLYESGSLGTDDSSPKFTPSSRSSHSSDGLAVTDDPDSYELRPITPRIEPAINDDDDEEEEGAFLHSTRRASMDSAQSYELYTPDEDRVVLRKLDIRLVGFMALLYSLNFLDRSNIGNARIAGLADDLNLSSSQYQWLLWAFYITYILFEWMTLMYRVVTPHIYISLCVLSWGLIASLQAITTSFASLLVLRALLGISEAAFAPGLPFYLSFFFRRHELAFRTGLIVSASPLSASYAGALAYGITKLGEQGPLSPWRLLFLLEGFPSVLIAVWAWDFVPDGPGLAKWLTPRQREVAVLRLRQEKDGEAEDQGDEKQYSRSKRGKFNIQEVIETFRDPKCYLTALMMFCCNVAFSSMPVFLPTIVQEMGWESITAQGLTAPPYLFSFVVVLTTAYYSDRLQLRSTFVILHSVVATLGYGTIAVSGYYKSENTTLRYIALFPAAAGFFSAITIIITWTINNQETDSKKGTAMTIMNVIGQTGPLVGTSIFPDEDGPYYVKGMSICAGFMLLVAFLAALLRWVLKRENRQMRDQGSGGGEYAGVPLDEDARVRRERKKFVFII